MSHSHSHHHHAHHAEHEHDRERAARHHGGHGEHSGPHLEARVTGSPADVAGYLSALADALRTGGVTIRSGERAVGLRLNGDVRLGLQAAAGDGGTSHLALDLAWQAPQIAPPAPRLEILSTHDAQQQEHERQQERQGNGGDTPDVSAGTQETGMPG